jgi:glycerate 2-kinase
VLRLTRFDRVVRHAHFAVTGEGTVDATTLEGKAPGAVLRHCRKLGVRCVIFGGRVVPQQGIEARALSGDPSRARKDLVELGEELAATAR